MTPQRCDSAAILSRLEAIAGRPGLSVRDARRCRALIARLKSPVRVAVLGLPDSGKRAVVNALAGAPVLPRDVLLPPVEIRFGPSARMVLHGADGAAEDRTGATLAEKSCADTLFAEIELPLERLQAISLLNVVAEASAEDMPAALAWAASRSDMAIWCTRSWTGFERQHWQAAPDRLKDHALLVAVAGTDGLAPDAGLDPGFGQPPCSAPLDIATGTLPPEAATRLGRHLDRMIAAARSEDLDVARLLADEHAPQEAEAPAPPLRIVQPAAAPQATAAPVAGRAPSAEAVAHLSRLFVHMRQSAAAALDALPARGLQEDDAAALLDRLHAALEELLDEAEAEHALAEAWPDLVGALRDANELVLLLKLEGGAVQAGEAAVLLAQLRGEVEHALVA